MAGHSKWANIKHRKGRQDEKRGKLFAKLSRKIIIAARQGGGDPDMNVALRTAVDAAKAADMPNDKIEHAVKRGTGEIEGAQYEEIRYEGYGPAGTALIIDVATDNQQRTVSEVRSAMKKYGGNLGSPGCVTWIFEQTGIVTVPQTAVDEETLFLLAAEAGANDIKALDDVWEVTTAPEDLRAVVEALQANLEIEPERAEVTMVPTTLNPVDENDAPKLFRLLEELEDNDDVQNVYSNFDISDELVEQLAS
jgi:YebC/PmpR family DNA-binding regulatory protein